MYGTIAIKNNNTSVLYNNSGTMEKIIIRGDSLKCIPLNLDFLQDIVTPDTI